MSLAAKTRLAAQAGPRRSAAAERSDRVVVIGGGAAGALAAHSLSRAGLRPLVIAEGLTPGHGVAYSTSDPLHRLNVPAGRMSVCPDDPDSFVRWIRANVDRGVLAGDFVPRAWYGDYLAAMLGDLVASGRAELLRGRVTGVARVLPNDPHAHGLQVSLADGRTVTTPAVVLAVGCPSPHADWAPPALAADPRLVTDPWSPGQLSWIAGARHRPRNVLLVGAGLTMVDVALSVAARNPHARITAVSRSGLLPTAHRPVPSAPSPTPDPPAGRITLDTAREIVAGSIATSVRETGDWRPGVDALRSITPALWGALSLPDRARFLREDRRRWDVLRHRMAPQVSDAISELRRTGRLCLEALGERTIADYPWRQFDAVVACTGQGGPLSADPLLAGLLDAGVVRPDPLGLGLDCDEDGRPLGRDGRAWPEVTVIGALRRGQLWESTAVPELRAQAHAVAARLATPSRPRLSAAV